MFGSTPFLIKQKTSTPDLIGGVTETWSDVKMIHGYLDMLTGSDQNTAQNAFVEQSSHILIVPTYTDGISDKMRVVDAMGRYYDITYVDDPVGQKHHLEIYLKYGGVE